MKICRVLLLFASALCARAQNYTCNNISKAYSDASCCAVEDGDTELARGVAAVYCAYGDSICVEGQYTSTCAADNLICKDCPNGFFTDSTSRLQCTACGAGQFQNMAGQSACTECAAGLYENAAGSSECKQCQGSSSSPGSSDCPHCVSGTGMQGGECKACPSGWGSVGLGHFNNSCKMFVEANPGYMLGGRCETHLGAFDPECSYALTGEVTNMTGMFQGWQGYIAGNDISAWNTASVTSMDSMFANSMGNREHLMYAHFNQDIGSWNTAAVTDMAAMFKDNWVFKKDLASWNTAAVKDMTVMFHEARRFSTDVSGWNYSSLNWTAHFDPRYRMFGSTVTVGGTGTFGHVIYENHIRARDESGWAQGLPEGTSWHTAYCGEEEDLTAP